MTETQLVRAIGMLEKEKAMNVRELSHAVKQFLIRKRLLKRTGKIVRALERYAEDQTGIITVKATIAHSLSTSSKEAIQKKAEAFFAPGKDTVKLVFHEDPKLLGGVRFETLNTRYDFSLNRALLNLRKSFVK